MRLQLSIASCALAATLFLALTAFASRAAAQAPPDASSANRPLDSVPEPTAESIPPRASPYVVRAASDIGAYGDTDHVFVFTPSVSGSVRNPTAGWSVDGHYLVDVVSAASVDIVSTASRRWEEVRHAGGLNASWKPESFGVAASAAFSVEPDYTSLTGGIMLSQDLRAKNVTLLGGYEHGHDVAGRSNTPFSVFSHAIDHDTAKLGLTFILDPQTIATGVAEAGFERGDSSKPYRYVPMFAPGTNVAKGASVDTVNALRLPERTLEQLPLSRNRYSVTARLAHRFDASTLRLEERLYDDSWALFASTTDVRYLIDVTKRFEIGPHARAHVQAPVSFWHRVYVIEPGFDFPALRTGDRELGPLYNMTAGGSTRFGFGPAFDPMQIALGFDFNATYTRYLDDLYVTSRISTVGGVSLEGTW